MEIHANNQPIFCFDQLHADRNSRLISVLEKLRHIDQERILITIDGPCGSGKSTLAADLAAIIGADIVHMDDFVIPHARKTSERLAIPGGNEDTERLMTEVITPWLAEGKAIYRPYLCHSDTYGDPVHVKGSLLILEGTYSNLPPIREHASLRLFIRVDPQEQQKRLLQRVGTERLVHFNKRWIPLENAYFSAYSLPDDSCLLISADYAHVE